MVFNTGAALLDAIVLAVVSREAEGTYGYKMLRRLQKDACLETYDKQIDGRNRRYYKITDSGRAQLDLYRREWKDYTKRITILFEGGTVE